MLCEIKKIKSYPETSFDFCYRKYLFFSPSFFLLNQGNGFTHRNMIVRDFLVSYGFTELLRTPYSSDMVHQKCFFYKLEKSQQKRHIKLG